jgi:hypothetical protein
MKRDVYPLTQPPGCTPASFPCLLPAPGEFSALSKVTTPTSSCHLHNIFERHIQAQTGNQDQKGLKTWKFFAYRIITRRTNHLGPTPASRPPPPPRPSGPIPK